MRLIITGAGGEIGSVLVEELSANHDLCLIDRVASRNQRSTTVDLTQHRARSYSKPWLKERLPRWMRLFEGTDVVVHLAGEKHPSAPWQRVVTDNIQGTWNVIEAAAHYGVSRVVFASSNWAVKSAEQELAPDCYRPEGPKIGSAVYPAPLTAYGLSKAMGELTGRMFVEEGRLSSFVAVRIGYYGRKAPKDDLGRTRWIGTDDIRSLFRRCVEAKIEGFHVVYGVSAQATSPYDLSHTRQLLSWQPRQMPS